MHSLALQAVSFGLTATISWGIADFFGAKASKKLGGYHTAFFVCVFAAIAYDLIYLIFLRSHARFDLTAVLYAIAAGVSFTLAMTSFYKGLEVGPVSIVSPLGSLYPLVTTLLLVTLFGNHLNTRQIIGIGVVVVGVSAASGIFERVQNGKRLGIGPLLGLAAAIFWGINFALLAQAIHRIGWQSATFVQQSCGALAFIFVLPMIARKEEPLLKKLPQVRKVFILGAALLQVVGFLALTIGIGRVGQLASIAVAVSACYPVITVFLALKNLGERLDPIPVIGALTSVIGIVILSIG